MDCLITAPATLSRCDTKNKHTHTGTCTCTPSGQSHQSYRNYHCLYIGRDAGTHPRSARPGPAPGQLPPLLFFFCQTITTLRLAQTQDSLKHTHTRPTGGVPLTQCVSQSFFFVFLLLTLCRHPWPVRQHHAISADFAQHVSVHTRFTGKLKKIHLKLYQHINIV